MDSIHANYLCRISLLLSIAFSSLLFSWHATAQNQAINTFTVPTTQLTFFDRDANGVLKLNDKGLPYQGKKETLTTNVDFSPQNTAFFVIDPWNNMPSDFLNQYYGKITEKYILPLIKRANETGYPVYIFTNDCKAIKPVPYSCEISQQFHLMTKNYPQVQLIYWQDIDLPVFVKSLRDKGISNLIYTGFASNMCVIGRSTGMINMVQQGFSLYFIPEASAAVETKESWQSQKIHKATTTIISQWMAKLIKYDDIYSNMKLIHNVYTRVP